MKVWARHIDLSEDPNALSVDSIEIGIWEPVPDKPGYVKAVGNRPVGDILTELVEKLKILCPKEMEQLDYGFNYDGLHHEVDPKDAWPSYRWIACYVVRGDSEGHYLHIDVLHGEDCRGEKFARKNITIAKTLDGKNSGMAAMYEIAKYAAILLDA